jgi:hypothetical protein
MHRTTVLKALVKSIPVQNYLEIGVDRGEIFYQIEAPLKIAIDPHFNMSKGQRIKNKFLKGHYFFEITSDAFFSTQQSFLKEHPIDLAFVDGLHTYKQCLTDILNCLNYLTPQGYIVVHDVNPPNEVSAYPVKSDRDEMKETNIKDKYKYWTGSWTGDVWKAIAHMRAVRNDLHIFTLDADWGIGIIRWGNPENKVAIPLEDIERADYTFFANHRYELLNLKPSHYFFEFIGQEK